MIYKADVLVVDDKTENLQVLSGMLRDSGYRVRPVPSGALALQAIALEPPDIILLDVMMPDMDGYEVCRRLKKDEETRNIPVVFLSALAETFDKVTAFSVGGIDYITKPFQFDEVRVRIETHLSLRKMSRELERYSNNLEEIVKSQIRELRESQMAIIFALAKLAQSRDDDTGKHLDRVQAFCQTLADLLSMDPGYAKEIDRNFLREIVQASPLHDIGKVGIPDGILLKPASLTPDEFEVMKTHTTIGARTLEEVRERFPHNGFIAMGIEIARSHHERWDGSGYPQGLAGSEIPLSARIMALVDVYDALRSTRVYKKALPHEESIRIIARSAGSHFDPEMAAIFLEHEEEFREMYDRLKD
jgi:putative two-component system response regulator